MKGFSLECSCQVAMTGRVWARWERCGREMYGVLSHVVSEVWTLSYYASSMSHEIVISMFHAESVQTHATFSCRLG